LKIYLVEEFTAICNRVWH